MTPNPSLEPTRPPGVEASATRRQRGLAAQTQVVKTALNPEGIPLTLEQALEADQGEPWYLFLVSPTVLRVAGYRFYFFSREETR
ncbi:MAG: hypothetical protein ACREMW_11225, partial [Gemmatimonadales bacterium]